MLEDAAVEDPKEEDAELKELANFLRIKSAAMGFETKHHRYRSTTLKAMSKKKIRNAERRGKRKADKKRREE